MAVKRLPGQIGGFERAAAPAGGAIAAGWLTLAAAGAFGLFDIGQPFQIALVIGAIATLAAGLDVQMLRAGGLGGPARTRRHLWRMSLTLAIAWGSFAAQPRAQAEPIRGAPWLIAPALITLALMAWWMFRTRDRRRRPALMPKEALS
jgi:hypothetical protein